MTPDIGHYYPRLGAWKRVGRRDGGSAQIARAPDAPTLGALPLRELKYPEFILFPPNTAGPTDRAPTPPAGPISPSDYGPSTADPNPQFRRANFRAYGMAIGSVGKAQALRPLFDALLGPMIPNSGGAVPGKFRWESSGTAVAGRRSARRPPLIFWSSDVFSLEMRSPENVVSRGNLRPLLPGKWITSLEIPRWPAKFLGWGVVVG